jgi:hypothetical protein
MASGALVEGTKEIAAAIMTKVAILIGPSLRFLYATVTSQCTLALTAFIYGGIIR